MAIVKTLRHLQQESQRAPTRAAKMIKTQRKRRVRKTKTKMVRAASKDHSLLICFSTTTEDQSLRRSTLVSIITFAFLSNTAFSLESNRYFQDDRGRMGQVK
jgi:hypothetical protein